MDVCTYGRHGHGERENVSNVRVCEACIPNMYGNVWRKSVCVWIGKAYNMEKYHLTFLSHILLPSFSFTLPASDSLSSSIPSHPTKTKAGF